MKKTILLISLIIGIQNIYAQSDTIQKKFKNKIGVEIGYNRELFKDLNFSPLNYSGGGSLISIHYIRTFSEDESVLFTDVNIYTNSLKSSDFDILTSSKLNGYIEIAYLHKLQKNQNSNTKLFLGSSYISDINYIDWLDLSFSYLASHGFAFKSMVQYHLKPKHQIQAFLTVPIAQIIVRPPYSGFDKETEELINNNIIGFIFKGKPTSINKYFGLFWKTTYSIQISNRWDLDFSYLINYRRLFDDNKFIQLNNSLTSTINYKF